MADLTRFTLRDMIECEAALRKLGTGAETLVEAAHRIVRYLFDHLIEKQTGQRACALVRFFKTHAFEGLTPQLQRFAQNILGRPAESPGLKCLTLLATAGIKPEWNSRETSVGHQAIPLASAAMVARFPMISQLLTQLGLEVKNVLQPDPALVLDLALRDYNLFYVPDAVGSPYVPAQEEFVIPSGIRSVLGFGSMLPSGNLFAVILFARVPIPAETAALCKPWTLSVKLAVLPLAEEPLFPAPGEPLSLGGTAP